MGKTAEKEQLDELTDDQKAEAEVKAKEEAEAKAAEELKVEDEAKLEAELEAEQKAADQKKAEDAKRVELEADGKTPEEIDEAIKDMSDETGEIEIVRTGTHPDDKLLTQAQLNKSVKSRVKKLNKKVEKVTQQSAETAGELEIANEKNKLLAIALEQARGEGAEVTAPDPDDFDLGGNDPEFLKKQRDHNALFIKQEVAEQMAANTETATIDTGQIQKAEALERKQYKHYERAASMGAKDYPETEEKALEILGNDIANHVIDNLDDSHVLLYYMGKNPAEAERIAELVDNRQIAQAFIELGKMSSELKIQTVSKVTADPDTELSGDVTPGLSTLERKLESLRDKAAETGDMAPLMAFKKEHNL